MFVLCGDIINIISIIINGIYISLAHVRTMPQLHELTVLITCENLQSVSEHISAMFGALNLAYLIRAIQYV